MKFLLCKLKRFMVRIIWIILPFLYKYYSIYKWNQIKFHKKIKVLFVLSELGAWKTECLYLAMLKHQRFEPIIGITSNPIVSKSEDLLKEYVQKKRYDYVDLDIYEIDDICPDIIFYYKPYDEWFPQKHIFKKHLGKLFCFVNYTFTTEGSLQYINFKICDYSLFVFVENQLIADIKKSSLGWRSWNVRVTGVPMQDYLLQPKDSFVDPWADKTSKKRIIYAPHHSIQGTNGNGIEFSTFLDFGEYMLEIADKYRNEITIAFKPHPSLYTKLLEIWGKQKTDMYYLQWSEKTNTQYEAGEYVGLFAYSDAMIHDCSSFQVEYLYTQKPVLFLDAKSYNSDIQNEFGQMANDLHYHASDKMQIEQFIINVIRGVDSKMEQRVSFYNSFLLPPNGGCACDNIINTILG